MLALITLADHCSYHICDNCVMYLFRVCFFFLFIILTETRSQNSLFFLYALRTRSLSKSDLKIHG